MSAERFTVAVVGAGAVGATMAYAMLVRGSARRVVLHDINAEKVRAEVLDLAHGAMFVPEAQVDGSDDVEVCRGADVVVVTAGAKQKPGQTRMDLAETTVDLMKKILPAVQNVAPEAIYVMVTNPVDVVTYASLKITDLPPHRIFGSGTVLDSSRLRWLVSEACDVAVANVHAYMAGEHGDTEVPLWSSAAIGGVPLLEWEKQTGRLGAVRREAIADRVVNAAYEVISGKGATNYAVGLAGARIVESIRRDERRVLPISTLLQDWHGITDVCMSVPTLVGAGGAGQRLLVPVDEDELARLQASAEAIRGQARRLGF
ncbi:L-lactate dehydrogenase [Nostocoides sp. F2B08]|uniref:L-lactate dehydrogenase n=1 Tax=Nostocoides sp. F2B08 TaxID=2653936 RepID=UPI0012635D5C|nr:L-lactate dehydrogenase [Tetrasphaera sp. F2B08]KAB7745476.1 L-lactate dehydrogenase [Tetrasphaera sp. F2B08]